MRSVSQLRRIALSLPEATEQDHHGRPSFRVRGKIFATLWDEEHVNVMLDLHQIRIAVNEYPHVCRAFWWGKQIRAVQLTLALATSEVARELLDQGLAAEGAARIDEVGVREMTSRPAYIGGE